MAYRIEFSPAAERELKKLSSKLSKRDKRLLVQCIQSLADNPRPEGSKKLLGTKDIYRVRSGNYRVVYTVRSRKLLVLILKVADRKDIYDRIKEIEKRALALLGEG